MQNYETNLNDELKKTLVSYQKLVERIKKLIKLVHVFYLELTELKKENEVLKAQINNENDSSKVRILEEEILRLKKENKTLKEREKTIRTKIERLSVKLKNIEV